MPNFENREFRLFGAPEKRIRHRLGLGRKKSITLDELHCISNLLGYPVHFYERKHWELESQGYYRIYTGDSKFNTRTYHYDIGVDSQNFVTAIFEHRSTDPDYGIGRILAKLFGYGRRGSKDVTKIEQKPASVIAFPKNMEKKIREVLGLANLRQVNCEQVVQLAKIHGYSTQLDRGDSINQLNVHLTEHDDGKFERQLQMTVGANDMIQSIILRSAS